MNTYTFSASEFDLAQIAESGQCFRWVLVSENTYRITAFGRVLFAVQEPGSSKVALSCTKEEFQDIWADYFDLETDYGEVIRRVPPEDGYLKLAAAENSGIRILRQDPWETLITFLISQRKNIPAIKQAVEKICSAAGPVITTGDCASGKENEEEIHAFPSPEELCRLTLDDLTNCSLGYRAKYIYKTAHAFADGAVTIPELEALSDEALFDKLCTLYGVGRKVAYCTMLFGFHRLDSFPVDVWMERIQKTHYPKGFFLKKYHPYAGIMQQYMFAYERTKAQEEKK